MSKGKGGETSTEIPPEFKQRILSAFDRGEALSKTAPIPYQGLTLAAPSDATKQYFTGTNDMANKLGVGFDGDILASLPAHEREMGGQKGYAAHRGYVQELMRAKKQYPEMVAQLNQLTPGLLNLPMQHRNKDGQAGAIGGTPGVPQMSYEDIVARYRGNGGFRV